MRTTRRRARAGLTFCVAVLLAVAACSGGDDGDDAGKGKDGGPAGTVAFAAADDDPCLLVDQARADAVLGEGSARTEGPYCVWANGPALLSVGVDPVYANWTLEAEGGGFTVVEGLGDAAGWEVSPGADSGRLVVRRGGLKLSLQLTVPGKDDTALRAAAVDLARDLLPELGTVEAEPAPTVTTRPLAEDCALADPEAVAAAVGVDLELGPEAADESCTLVGEGVTVVLGPVTPGVSAEDVERYRPRDEDLAGAGQSITDIEGLGDQAFLITLPSGPDTESGQLLVVVGDQLVNVGVQGVADAQETATAVAEVVLAGL